MPMIDKESTHLAIREEYDRHKALYDLYHHTERGGIVQGLSYASVILAKQPEVPDIDRSAILRLCSEIEDAVTEAINLYDFPWLYYAFITQKLKEIGKELTGDAES